MGRWCSVSCCERNFCALTPAPFCTVGNALNGCQEQDFPQRCAHATHAISDRQQAVAIQACSRCRSCSSVRAPPAPARARRAICRHVTYSSCCSHAMLLTRYVTDTLMLALMQGPARTCKGCPTRPLALTTWGRLLRRHGRATRPPTRHIRRRAVSRVQRKWLGVSSRRRRSSGAHIVGECRKGGGWVGVDAC